MRSRARAAWGHAGQDEKKGPRVINGFYRRGKKRRGKGKKERFRVLLFEHEQESLEV